MFALADARSENENTRMMLAGQGFKGNRHITFSTYLTTVRERLHTHFVLCMLGCLTLLGSSLRGRDPSSRHLLNMTAPTVHCAHSPSWKRNEPGPQVLWIENVFAQSFGAVSRPGSAAKHFELKVCTWTQEEKNRVRAELDACDVLSAISADTEVIVDVCDGNVTLDINASVHERTHVLMSPTHFGNYFHTVIDYFIPALATVMFVADPNATARKDVNGCSYIDEGAWIVPKRYGGAYYSSGVRNVMDFAGLLGLSVGHEATLSRGTYRRLVLNNIASHTIDYRTVTDANIPYWDDLECIYQFVSRKLRCTNVTAPNVQLLATRQNNTKRSIGNIPEVINVLNRTFPMLNVVDLGSMTTAEQRELMCRANVLVGITGAAFVNQLFMPPRSTLIIIHVPYGVAKIETWHRAVAQYLGHRVIDLALPQNLIPKEIVETLSKDALDLSWYPWHPYVVVNASDVLPWHPYVVMNSSDV